MITSDKVLDEAVLTHRFDGPRSDLSHRSDGSCWFQPRLNQHQCRDQSRPAKTAPTVQDHTGALVQPRKGIGLHLRPFVRECGAGNPLIWNWKMGPIHAVILDPVGQVRYAK